MDGLVAAAEPARHVRPTVRAPLRVAVLDIGSNSVRLVVFEGEGRSPYYFFNDKTFCGLGSSLERTGTLDPDGRARAITALRRYRALCDTFGVAAIEAVATAAVREARDGLEFVRDVRERAGIEVVVASGADEARLTAFGVLLGAPDAKGLAADLGGASLEVAEIGAGEVGSCASLPIGPLRRRREALEVSRDKAEIDRRLESCELLRGRCKRLYIVGGSWRALARIHMNRTRYPLRVLHEYSLRRAEARALARWAQSQPLAELKRFSDASDSRLEVTPYGALVLDRLIRRLRPKRIMLSAFGVREGVFYRHLPERLRMEDPLIAACAEFERRRARFPGYGAELYEWLRPLFSDRGPGRQRLIRACCLANDVEWREHPDYRAAIAFEAMMRVNVSGVNHRERVFVASALMFRHKGGRRAANQVRGFTLVSERTIEEAAALGRAMGFADSVTGAASGILPRCPLRVGEREIVMTFPPEFAALADGAAERGVAELAAVFGRGGRIELTPAGSAAGE